jgi:transcriptional regulator with XRE-family HTH domain
VHLACELRSFRGERTLKQIAAASGVPQSMLSMIERGLMVPTDHQVDGLEKAYGQPISAWYDRPTLLALRAGDGS